MPIDQFEEVFTTTGLGERSAFLALLAAAFDRDLPFMVVATGRSDVLEGLVESSELVHRHDPYPLAAMPLERVPRLVEGPAAVAALTVEKGLSERIVRDVESAEALPLLAHMLRLLYERGGGDKKLAIAEYDALGDPARGLNPIQNSVRLAADEALARVKPSEPELTALRDAFVPHLVRVRLEDGKRVRQPARRSELPAEALRLIGALVEARLLTTRGGAGAGADSGADASGETIVEVTHESLFKAWPTLDLWLTEDQAFLTDLERIRDAHENWTRAPAEQKGGELLYGLILSRARDWLLKYPQRFLGREMEPLRAFIAASAEAADAERAREAAAETRRRRIERGALVGTVAGIVALGVVLWFAIEARRAADHSAFVARDAETTAQRERDAAKLERDRAEEQRKIAEQQRNHALITQSRFLVDLAQQAYDKGDHGTAVALALEALPDERRGKTRPYVAAAESMLYRAVTALRERHMWKRDRNNEDDAKLMPDGQRIITFSPGSNTPRIRDATTAVEIPLTGHTGGVTDIAFSPSGQQIATASSDGTARTWSATDGRPLGEFKAHAAGILSVAFSPNGQQIVTASLDGTAGIWDATNDAAPPTVLPIPGENIGDAAFSPDGKRVATTSSPNSWQRLARIWDAASGDLIKVIGGNSEGVGSAAWTDGRLIVAISSNDGGKARIWDVASGGEIGEVPAEHDKSRVAFSPDGRRIAVALPSTLRLWEASPRISEWQASDYVTTPVFSPDGRRMAAFLGNTMKILDVDRLDDPVASLDMPEATTGSPDFSRDGRQVLVMFHDTARVWDVTDNVAFRLLHQAAPVGRGPYNVVSLAAFSPDGRMVVTASGDHTAKIWDAASGRLLATKQHPGAVHGIAFLQDKQIVTVSEGKLRRWDAIADAAPVVLGEQETFSSVAASPDGKRIVTGILDIARIWDASANAPPTVSGKHPGPVLSASFSPDGRQVITVSGGRAWLWNAMGGSAPAPLGKSTGVQTAVFSPDGTHIVLGHSDGTVRIVNSGSHEVVMAWQAHDKRIETAAFSPGGKRVVTAADQDNSARIWDAKTGTEVAVLRGHDNEVFSAAYSSDGRIVTTSRDRSVRLWQAFETTQGLIDHARKIMPRELTEKQRQDAFLDPALAATPPSTRP